MKRFFLAASLLITLRTTWPNAQATGFSFLREPVCGSRPSSRSLDQKVLKAQRLVLSNLSPEPLILDTRIED